MKCTTLVDKIYEFDGRQALSLWNRLQIAVHIVLCPRCAEKTLLLEAVRDLLRTDFLPVPPAFIADSVMDRIRTEVFDTSADMPFEFEEEGPTPEVPFGGWVATGLIILFSLTASFMDMDFISLAAAQGSSFLLPLGITIGVVITVYGAIFIGSHLEELSDRFRLR
ncbi:MAG: peptidoglycan-binding protein [Treponema sp.]|jgi:hypothetical protein|nr:peptidoglycan-binding protein [Treponema sp.]